MKRLLWLYIGPFELTDRVKERLCEYLNISIEDLEIWECKLPNAYLDERLRQNFDIIIYMQRNDYAAQKMFEIIAGRGEMFAPDLCEVKMEKSSDWPVCDLNGKTYYSLDGLLPVKDGQIVRE